MAITTAKGTQILMMDAGSPFTGAPIGQVRSITGMTLKSHTVDVTTHDTPGFFRKFIAVIMDGITASFDINFDHLDATHAFSTGLYDKLVNLTKETFEQIFPNSAGTLHCDGYINSHDFNAPIDNVLVAKIAIQFTDAVRVVAA